MFMLRSKSTCLGRGHQKQEPRFDVWWWFQVQCTAQVTEGAVEVTVSGLKATDTDIYRCDIEIFYPPPYLRLTGNGTLIHVLGETPTRATRRHALAYSPTEFTAHSFSFICFLYPQRAALSRRRRDWAHTRVMKKRAMRVMGRWRQSAFPWWCWWCWSYVSSASLSTSRSERGDV